ncbi:MAG: twin-arginine translocase TatA/TatE family subunit [Thermoanaerobaculia bacterium]
MPRKGLSRGGKGRSSVIVFRSRQRDRKSPVGKIGTSDPPTKRGDHMFGLGAPELILVLLIIVLIFGTSRLPRLGRALGETISGLREGLRSTEKEADR